MSRFMDADVKAGRIMRKQDDALEDLYAKERTLDDDEGRLVRRMKERKFGKAMSAGAVSGEAGFTPVPEVVDGQVNGKDLDKREEELTIEGGETREQ